MGIWDRTKSIGGKIQGFATDSVMAPINALGKLDDGDVKGALKDVTGYNATSTAFGGQPPPPEAEPPAYTSGGVFRSQTPVSSGNTPPAAGAPEAPGTLDGPGAGEQYWEENKGKWGEPTESEQNWQGLQGYFQAPTWKPETSTTAYDKYMTDFGETQPGVTTARDAVTQLSGEGFGETGLKGMVPGYQAPGAAEDFFEGHRQELEAPGMGESFINDHLGQFDIEGDAETNYDEATDALDKINFGASAIDLTNKSSGENNRTSTLGTDLEDYFGSNPVEDEYSKFFAAGMRGPSNSETLFDSGKGESGLTTYFARAQEKAQRALDDAMASRGLMNGEASIRGSIELGQDFGAQQAKAMSDMALRADEQRLARTGEARNFVTAGATEGRLRRGQQIGVAESADKLGQAGTALGLDALNFASDEGIKKVEVKTDAADKSQGRQLERQGKGVETAVSGQKLGLDRLETLGGFADTAQGRELDRMGALGKLFETTQGLTEDRLELGAGIGLDADTSDLNRGTKVLDGAMDLDGLNLDAEKFGLDKVQTSADIAGGVDAAELAKLNSGATVAGNTQTLEENRETGALDNILKVTDGVAGGFQAQMDGMLSDYAKGEEDRIQAMLDSGQIDAEEAARQRQQTQQTIADLGKMYLSSQGRAK